MLEKLYRSIRERWRPEDVAKEILNTRVLPTSSTRELEALACRSGYTSMGSEFEKAVDMAKQLRIAAVLFPTVQRPEDPDSPDQIEKYIKDLRGCLRAKRVVISKERPDRRDRLKAKAPFQGHRAYNKRYRLVARMQDKVKQYRKNLLMRGLAQVAKSRLAFQISAADFQSDVDTALYIAYITSRFNLRSVFTNEHQKRAYDGIADMLFSRLDAKRANWYAIAMVDPSPLVLQHLNSKERGRLVGEWFEVMRSAVSVLRDLTKKGSYNLEKMIVRRGNDSSTWNEAAGAYNKCRQAWINALATSGMQEILKDFCPGKALRLMAADVVRWHSGSDGLDPDTKAWNLLPKPWEVVLEGVRCSRYMVVRACKKSKLDPKLWLQSSDTTRKVELTGFTPELVYGVEVGSPGLAKILKKAGFFAGPSKTKGHDEGIFTITDTIDNDSPI